ncbi:6-phosphogluconolactonase [Ketobacter sp.]
MVSIKKNLCAKDQLPTQAAKSLASIIVASVKNRGHCYCALSGGSSPKPMLSALAQENLPWNDVSFLLVDERWSNEASQQNISMITEFVTQTGKQNIDVFSLLLETEFESNLAACEQLAQSLPQQLDLIVLGMGLDGHTASLFPDAEEYQSAMTSSQRYVSVTPPEAPHRRISMSFDWISRARHVALYIPGKDKLSCFETILNQSESISPIKELVLQAPEKLTVFSSED